jgi:hypothetical protein
LPFPAGTAENSKIFLNLLEFTLSFGNGKHPQERYEKDDFYRPNNTIFLKEIPPAPGYIDEAELQSYTIGHSGNDDAVTRKTRV